MPDRRRTAATLLLGPVLALAALVLGAAPAAAHPLDVYVQSSYVTIGTSNVDVELDLSPGVFVAPRVLPSLDGDGDRTVSAAEARAYGARVLSRVQVQVDGVLEPLVLTTVDTPPYLTLQAGYGTLRVHATASGAPSASGEHRVLFRNSGTDPKAAYQVNAFVARGAPVTLVTQQRDAAQRQSLITYQVGTGGTNPATPPRTGPATPAVETGRLATYLSGSLSAGTVLLALGAALLLGALHALTPGHAKTLMAAYLVGSGGTVRDALALGAVVTFTHTASVVLIGLVALLASAVLVPGVLVPVLELVAGVLVVGLGLRLLRQRWLVRRSDKHDDHVRHHEHEHEHDHDHVHEPDGAPVLQHAHHGPELVTAGSARATRRAGAAGAATATHTHTHTHGGMTHSHALPQGGVTPRNLVALGVSGGLVPCPEALGVMVVAVGLGRTVLGLGLIVAFSLGLAAVLMGLGLFLVRSRSLVARFDGAAGSWTTALPLVSAVVVTVLGLALVLQGLGVHVPLLG